MKVVSLNGGAYAMDVIRVILSLSMLAYASFKDWRTREVNDLLWVLFGSIGVVINIYAVLTGTLDLITIIIPIGISAVFALAVWYMGLFGEADLLALITVTLLSPLPPRINLKVLAIPPLIMPLTVITNSILIAACSALVILTLNLLNIGGGFFDGYEPTRGWKKALLLMTGRKVDLSQISGPPFEYPLEKLNENGKVSLFLRPKIMEDEEAASTFTRLREAGRTRVWVSFTLPFLIFIFSGYVCSLIIGDIVLGIMIRLF